MFYIVTYATHSERYFEILKESCPELVVLGYGTKWTGFQDKTNALKEFCANKDPNDIVCFVDGFDSVIIDSSELEKRYMEMGHDLVFSNGSLVKCDLLSKYIIDKIFSACEKDGSAPNSGMYIGKAKSISKFWEDFKGGDDQEYTTKKCDEIYVDTEHKLFYNMGCDKNELEVKNGKVYKNGSIVSVISSPGGHSELNPILEKLGYDNIPVFKVDMKRRIKTYGKYFLPEFIWLLLSIILLYKIRDKKIGIVMILISFFGLLKYEVKTKHSKNNKIISTLIDVLYLSIIFSFPFFIKNPIAIILFISCILFYRNFPIQDRIKYLIKTD